METQNNCMKSLESSQKPSVEHKEQKPNIETETLTAEELEDRIYSGDDIKPRFEDPRNGGVFKLFFAEDLGHEALARRSSYSIIEENDVIVGIGRLLKERGSDNRTIASISIDPAYQNKGYGRKLLDEMFRFAKENNWSLKSSPYTKDGWEKLKPLVDELVKKHEIEFTDKEEKWF